MDIKFIEHHNRPGIRVIKFPLYGLPGGRFLGRQGRIARLGKIHPHALHGMIEGIVVSSSAEESLLWIIEYRRKLSRMTGEIIRYRALNPEIIMICPAACRCMVLRHTERGRNEDHLISKTAGLIKGIPRSIVQKRPGLFQVLFGHGRKPVLSSCGKEFGKPIRRHKMDELAHFVLVAAFQEIDLTGLSLEISIVGIQWNEIAVPLRPDLQGEEFPDHIGNFLRRKGEKIGHSLTVQCLQRFICSCDCLLSGACKGRRTALGDNAADIAPGLGDQWKQRDAAASRRFAEDRDIVRVSSEGSDVLMNPSECHHLIQDSQILGIRVICAVRQMGEMEKAQAAQTICDGNQNNVSIIPHEIEAVV